MPLQMEKIITADGSHTLFAPQFDEHYHSIHGAIQESQHVFIQAGYGALPDHLTQVRVLEMGFGTGLNAFLTYLASQKPPCRHVVYQSIEAYPLTYAQAISLNYAQQLQQPTQATFFEAMHKATWNEASNISPHFELHKHHADLLQMELPQQYFHLVYYDAFAPTSQPELWTADIFAKLYAAMQYQGILVTYCAKGVVKRALKSVGFELQTLPGPPHKREMTRAIKANKPIG
jgi:tRNA U34 5-methylaminomethyl-2-thiouridine-forming methyltransferase MnmC